MLCYGGSLHYAAVHTQMQELASMPNQYSCEYKREMKLYCHSFCTAVAPTAQHVQHESHCSGLGGPLHGHIATTYSLWRDAVLNELQY